MFELLLALSIVGISEWITIVAGGLAALVGLYYTFAKILKKPLMFFKRAFAVPDKLDNLSKDVQLMKHEVMRNGGSSIKDSMDRVENRQIITESREKALLNTILVPYFESNVRGECIDVNRAYRRLTGRSTEELLGNSWVSIIHPEDQDKVIDKWEECIEQKREFAYNYRIIDTSGQVILVHCQTYAVIGNNRELIGYLGTMTKMVD